ncbi:MAG: 2-oxo-4-hydroxy-4-carboxy-5-ureidoimidazoline decarboxylase [Kyrpidia sp.]|nr:2-oxo-4-hydroxy-4-carboxy-5-ureidoimidazoline decarboxylase [Kyrpidia sp.]
MISPSCTVGAKEGWRTTITVEELNRSSEEAFVSAVGWLFEHSPWVAERAWRRRPFRSVEHLFECMAGVVKEAELEKKLALFRAHPDLGTRLSVSEASKHEQRQAGLDRLTPGEYEEFVRLNQQYVRKFGFPFIMAVRGQTKEAIRKAMKERLGGSPETEVERALAEVLRIAWFRLKDMGMV